MSALLNVFVFLLVLGFGAQLNAQVTSSPSSASFSSVTIGATASTQTLTITVPSGLTLGGISALTQGAPSLDFTVVGSGTTCATGTTATTCTVEVQFLPTLPGLRLGGVVLSDGSGNELISIPLIGTGTGPLVGFEPGIISSMAEIPGVGAAVDGAGNVYVADAPHSMIRKVTPSNVVTTVAGAGTCSCFSGDGGLATAAQLYYPSGVAVDGSGNIYIADTHNHRIREVTPNGIINTVAGNGTAGYTGDSGPATSAELDNPYGVAVDGSGNIYIADSSNNVIRKVAPGGTITTVAGNGTGGYSGDSGAATSAELHGPYGVAVDGSGNIYIADTSNNVIREVSGGTITTVAGNGTLGYSGDGGAATSAELNQPTGVTVDGAGNLYIADMGNSTIRKVTSGTTITTVAGTGASWYNGDGGPATSAYLDNPYGVAVDGSGNLYIADRNNRLLRKVDVSDAPLVNLGSIAPGSSGTQDVTVVNQGNATLTIGTISTSSNVSLDSDTTCSSTSQVLTASASCVVGIDFTPASSSYTTGSLVLTDNNLNASSVTQAITVQNNTPVITWTAPTAITYGTALSGIQLNAKAVSGSNAVAIAGTYAYSPAAGTVLGAGPHTLAVTFTPSNSVANSTASASVTLTVNQATPKITWTKPTAITYGTALTGTQLSAATPVAGIFAYTPAAGTVLAPGTQTLSVTFTPTDTTDYTTSTASVTITVNKATPTVTWATPSAISYGTALSSTQLNATASVPGTFVYSPAASAVLAGGSQTLRVTFTPTNATDYATETASVTLLVNPSTPTITWTTPAAIAYGTALSATQLNAKATLGAVTVAGTFAYTPALGTVLAAGTHTLSVVFTPTSAADYNTPATATVSLPVNKATPKITWTKPAAITYGTALSGTQLSATTSVAGTFAYSPAASTVLAAGTQTLSVTFTPTDTADYTSPTATVTITVNKAAPTVSWTAPSAVAYGTALSSTQLNATASVPGTFVYSPAAGAVVAGGSQTLRVTFTPTNATDYATETASVTLPVNPSTPTLTWATPTAIAYGTVLSATQLDARTTFSGATVAGTYAYTPALGTALAVGTQTLSVVFTPTNAADYNTPAPATVTLLVNKATPRITWAAPAAITHGTALSITQLNATAASGGVSVPGTFTYSPVAGTVLAAGTHTLSVTFTPTDTTDYNATTATTSILVRP